MNRSATRATASRWRRTKLSSLTASSFHGIIGVLLVLSNIGWQERINGHRCLLETRNADGPASLSAFCIRGERESPDRWPSELSPRAMVGSLRACLRVRASGGTRAAHVDWGRSDGLRHRLQRVGRGGAPDPFPLLFFSFFVVFAPKPGALPQTPPGASPLDLTKGPLALWTPASRLSSSAPLWLRPRVYFFLFPYLDERFDRIMPTIPPPATPMPKSAKYAVTGACCPESNAYSATPTAM